MRLLREKPASGGQDRILSLRDVGISGSVKGNGKSQHFQRIALLVNGQDAILSYGREKSTFHSILFRLIPESPESPMNHRNASLLSMVAFWSTICVSELQAAKVTTVQLPNFAQRPLVNVDQQGTVHVVCGHAKKHGDLYYFKQKTGEAKFSDPIQVNSTPGCAAAFNLAVGKNGRVHVLIRPNAKYSRDVLKRQPKFNDLKFPSGAVAEGA